MKKNGFTLLELVIVLCVILILAAMAIPNVLSVIRAAQQTSAKQQVGIVVRAEAALAICTAASTPCGNVASLLPPVGTLSSSAYHFVMTATSYTGTPIDPTMTTFHGEAANGWQLYCGTNLCS